MSVEILNETKEELEIKEPGMYKVIIHNDDYTTMEFVIFILMRVFNKNNIEASKITMEVHKKQSGIAGIYTKDIAASKIKIAEALSKENKFPLRFTMEKE